MRVCGFPILAAHRTAAGQGNRKTRTDDDRLNDTEVDQLLADLKKCARPRCGWKRPVSSNRADEKRPGNPCGDPDGVAGPCENWLVRT